MTSRTPAQAGPVTPEWHASPHIRPMSERRLVRKCHFYTSGWGALIFRTEIETDAPARRRRATSATTVSSTEAANVASGPVDSFALASGHSLEGTSSGDLTSTCSSCHTAHQDSARSPMLPQGSGPTGPDWCYRCHGTEAWFDGEYPPPETPDRNASGYPVAGTWLGPDYYGAAGNAHRLIPETTQTAGDGGDVGRKQGDCLYCHSAHRGPSTYDGLRAPFRPSNASTLASDQADGTYALVCFNCHGGAAPSGFTTAPVDIKQFATAGDANSGHSVVTSGGLLPVGAPLPCYECHNPHGTTRGNDSMLSDTLGGSLTTTGSAEAVRRFCFTCHTTNENLPTGWDSQVSTYTVVQPADEVVGISRTAGVLALPPVDGHAQTDTGSCYGCHGDDYTAGGNNVHNPNRGAVPGHISPTNVTCFGAGCHDPSRDLSAVHALYVGPGSERPQYATTCELCHENPAVDVSAAADMRCTGVCHSGTTHSGYAAGHALTASSTECVSCHPSDISTVHGASTPGPEVRDVP